LPHDFVGAPATRIRRPRPAHPALVQDEQLLKVPMGKYEHLNVKFNFTGNSFPGLSESHGALYGSAADPGRFLAGLMCPAPERSTVSADAPELSSGQIAGLALDWGFWIAWLTKFFHHRCTQVGTRSLSVRLSEHPKNFMSPTIEFGAVRNALGVDSSVVSWDQPRITRRWSSGLETTR